MKSERKIVIMVERTLTIIIVLTKRKNSIMTTIMIIATVRMMYVLVIIDKQTITKQADNVITITGVK